MENIQLTNLRKAKIILEAEIERLERNGRTNDQLAEESMQLLQNGLSPDDYFTIEQLQSQGKLDFNNFAIDRVYEETDGHTERALAVLDYLLSRLYLFLETTIQGEYEQTAKYADAMFVIARIATKTK